MKVIATHTFSKKERDQKKLEARQNVIEPSDDRVKPKLYQGYLLQKDSGGYFILKPSPNSVTMIREDLPHSLGYALALQKD